MSEKQYTSIGGQAVIEGVMMKSPNFVAVAVRKPDGRIIVKHEPYSTVFKRFPLLKKPLLRGVVTLVESMVQGMRALSFSAEIGDEKSGEKPMTRKEVVSSMVFAFAMAMALFVALPHGLTVLLTSERFFGIPVESPVFHLIDGLFKMGILVLYIYAISRLAEIRRVFQYHGAEHKSIYAFEDGRPLTVENARVYTTLHPRCGTSFLLFLVLISIVVFSILFPVLGLTTFSRNPIPNHAAMIGMKMLFMFPVAGIAYEVIKWSARHTDRLALRVLMAPGLWLQNLTTKQPDDSQLEVALASLRQVLKLEKDSTAQSPGQFEIAHLSEIVTEAAPLQEFLEA